MAQVVPLSIDLMGRFRHSQGGGIFGPGILFQGGHSRSYGLRRPSSIRQSSGRQARHPGPTRFPALSRSVSYARAVPGCVGANVFGFGSVHFEHIQLLLNYSPCTWFPDVNYGGNLVNKSPVPRLGPWAWEGPTSRRYWESRGPRSGASRRIMKVMRRSETDRSKSMTAAAWEKVCTLAAILIFQSDGEMPAANAIGESVRMRALESRK